MTEMTRHRLSTGIEIDAQDTGPRDAPVLLFLHGFPESHRTWRHQIAHFADRYRCIAPDQRGYRGSSKPQEVEAYTPDRLIGDVFALADACGVERFTLVGHDWGGAIAWGGAVAGGPHGNNRVERLIIANAPHPWVYSRLLWEDRGQREAAQYIRAFRDPANDDLVREQGLAGLLMKAIRWDRPAQMEPQERDALLADWQDREAAFAMLNWYRASSVTVPPMDAPFEAPAALDTPFARIEVPTLVIWAEDDLALPPSNLDRLDEVVPDLTIERIAGSGHFVPWEAPDAVNAAMERWLG